MLPTALHSKRVELLEATSHYALIKDQRGITKNVSVQDLAPYPSKVVQNSGEVQLQDFDELAIKATNSNPRVLIPKLSLPDNILRSSKSNNQDVNFNEPFKPSTNEIEDNKQPCEKVESSSNTRGSTTKSGRMSKMPTSRDDEFRFVYKK